MSIDWTKKKVVVTGGTGFIGSFFVEELLKKGASVRVPIRSENYRSLSALRSRIEWMEGDLRDPDYCLRLIMGADYVFHLASHRRNVAFHRDHAADVLTGNVDMSLALIKAMREYPSCHTVFFSSANVPPHIDVIDLAQQQSTDGYVLGKAVAETLWMTASKQYRFPLLIVRPVGVYGERDTFSLEGNVIPSLMLKASEATDELVVWGSGAQERVFLYVHDLVGVVFTFLEHSVDGIQYVMPHESVTIAHLAEKIKDIIQPNLRIIFDISKPEGKRSIATMPNHFCLENFPWTPLQDGLKKTYAGWKKK